MELEVVAKRFAELGHPTRLAIFHQLVRCGQCGCSVGEIQKSLDIPGSTLSHHLSKLVSAGLLEQKREGRTLRCIPSLTALNEVVQFLTEEYSSCSCSTE